MELVMINEQQQKSKRDYHHDFELYYANSTLNKYFLCKYCYQIELNSNTFSI